MRVLKCKNGYATPKEVAEWLGIGVRTVTDFAAKWVDTYGEEGIPGFKVGKQWRFDPEDLERWLQQQKKLPSVLSVNSASG